MKKLLFVLFTLTLGATSFGQSIKFDQLLHLLKEKNVEKYLTSAPINFIKTRGFMPDGTYKKNSEGVNDEEIGWEPKTKMVIYNTTKVEYMDNIIKQIKYPRILKSVDPKTSTYYQYGNTKMLIMIDVYGKKRASLTMYEK